MRVIFKIARAELRSLFYSPIAWVVMVLFFFISEIQVVLQLLWMVALQEHYLETQSNWSRWEESLTVSLFKTPFFSIISSGLGIFMPLLTMGIINKEINGGTIKLLYSSPINIQRIVLGKLTGLMGFVCLLLASVAIIALIAPVSIANLDYKMFFTAFLGCFLLAGAYASMGLFISALTNYQIVAGVITFTLFFVLDFIGRLWQQYDFVRDLTYFLSISGRVDNLQSGLLTSRDICYFLLIIAMFISFSIIRLRSITESSSWRVPASRYLTVFSIVLMLGYFSSRPGYIYYLDVTNSQMNTIHPETQKIVKSMGEEPMTVTLYTNLFDGAAQHGFPQNRNFYVWNFWDKYVRFHPNIQLKYVYYYDIMDADSNRYKESYPKKTLDEVAQDLMIANEVPASIFKKPEEIRSLIDLSSEGKRLIMKLEYKGKETYLRTYSRPVPWPMEIHVSAAISRLVNDTFPLVLYTTGHYERSPYKMGEKEYTSSTLFKLSETALINTGADVDTINLEMQNIPPNISMLVVADPRSAMAQKEQDKIQEFIAQGGNVVFYGEPGKQQLLNPLLNKLGVNLESGQIVNPNDHEMPHVLVTAITKKGVYMAGELLLYLSQIDSTNKPAIKQVGAAAITYTNDSSFKVEPIFDNKSNDLRWIENGMLVVDSAAPQYSPIEGDVKRDRYVTGITLSRTMNNKEQRMFISSDADFMSDLRGAGGAFGNAAYSWLVNNEYPKYTNRPPNKDVLFTITSSTAESIKVIYLYVIPLLITLLGIMLLIRRNRK